MACGVRLGLSSTEGGGKWEGCRWLLGLSLTARVVMVTRPVEAMGLLKEFSAVYSLLLLLATVYFYLKDTDMKVEIFHSLVHSSNVHNS